MAFLPVLPGSVRTYGTGVYGTGVYGGQNITVAPLIEVLLDHTNNPTSTTETWTDITPYVVSYQRTPVRQNEFDQPQPATGTITLRNDDGRFIPDNTSGPYYPGLKKYRRIWVRASWNGTVYDRFKGYVVDWPQTWAMAGKNQTVTLNISDGLTPLLTYDLGGQVFGQKLSGVAVRDVLLSAGITSYSLDGGVSTIPNSGTITSPSYALQRVQNIGATENGVVYAAGNGQIQFHDRHHRLSTSVSATVQATIGDSPGEVRYYDTVQPQYGDAWPIVNVTPSGGSVVSAVSSGGTASFFQQTLNYPPSGQYLVTDPVEAQSAAQYVVNRYSAPVTRVPNVTLTGIRDTAQWPAILSLDTSDRVIFKRRFLSNGTVGGTVTLNCFVEGFGDDVTVGQDWKVTTPLSPADTQAYWLAADPVYGLAGQTTKAGY